MKFINNELIAKISSNEQLEKYLEKSKISWVNYPEFIKKMYQQLSHSAEYLHYMNENDTSFESDRDLVEFFYTDLVAPSDDLYQLLEEESIYWNDDVEFVVSMILKTFRKFKAGTLPSKALMPLFKDEEDSEFTKKLFRKSVLDSEMHRNIIKDHLRNWDLERVAFIDVLIMEMAIC
ncbi:MAG TPA: transcription antitermination factor NusB, partial [Prolixibacteraceae bacterium]|nr:transcription antitermination factor NusB [Prolixibacteraceae bacterium]